MTDILIRNVDKDIADALKRRAKKHGRSLQAELKLVLADAVDREASMENFLRAQRLVSEDTRTRHQTSSTVLIREERDS